MERRDQLHVLSAYSPVSMQYEDLFAPHSVTKLPTTEGSVAPA